MIGANRSVANVITAGKYVSPLVVSWTVALVAPFGIAPVPLSSAASIAKLLTSAGLRVVTLTPKLVIAPSKKLVAGRAAVLAVSPSSDAVSPVIPVSPSYAMKPTVTVGGGPEGGV